MKVERRGESHADNVLSDALGTLANLPGVNDDPNVARALEVLVAHLQPVAPTKSQQLARAVQIVSASLDLDEVLRNALALALEVMHAERGFLMLRAERQIAALYDPDGGDVKLADDRTARAIVEHVFETGEPLFTTDAQLDPAWSEQSVVALHVRALACVPLRVRESLVGVIYLDSRVIPGVYEQGDRELLLAFGHQAALAVENARLFAEERERTRRLSALQDFQTGLLEAIANGVVTLSSAGRITSFNRAAEATFGIPAEQLLEHDVSALNAVLPEFPEMLGLYRDNGGVLLRAEVEGRRSDGSRIPVEIRLTPLDSPGGTGIAVVVTDVSRQRKLEEENAAERARASAIQQSFSRYLAPHVVQSLIRDPSSVRLGGERRRATMLFADIRGFTSLAATLSPERVVEILNTYFEVAVRIVFEHDGLLDKFYGDGLMAVFGAPRACEDDAQRAVEAALRLHDAVRGELAKRLDYPIAISTGLATGDVVAGHFGSQRRMDYTVIGDAVNLAQGLQSAAPPGGIYLDEETYRLTKPTSRAFHRIGARIKGRRELVTVYAMFPEGPLARKL
jgi:adenylate cyclase